MTIERLAIVSASGVFIAVLGYLIKNKGMMNLIAGYDSSEVSDDVGLANFIGRNLYAIAALTFCVGVFDYYGFEQIWIIYVIILFGSVVWMSRHSGQYTH
ncbi:DUF3784 domain-containing protein [Halocatena salina]|uniref:DUF3784 domain-containing protein n=1 Tax=Halocatena salina TaxID=2934340 RepID=A0A8U0A8E1_9EURY|nr:DUF3784 domain-containing protein [Halocatena salina]UPM44758.1 DUF3784 domain-containing protein [Halocatena salina]